MPDSVSSDVGRMADRFRADVIARERAAGSAMVDAYGRAWQALKGQLDDTLREIQERRDGGGTVSVGWVRGLERVQSLQSQAEVQLGRFADFASEATRAEQAQAVHAAQVHAMALVQAQVKPGASVVFDRLHTRAVEHLVGFGTDGAPLAALFKTISPATADRALQSLVTGVVIGTPVGRMAELLRDELGTGLTRAMKPGGRSNWWARGMVPRAFFVSGVGPVPSVR